MTIFNTNFLGTLPFSDQTYQVALAANTELTVTIPGTNANLYRCEFSYSYDADVWVGFNTTAVVPPAGAITTVTNESLELRPSVRYVRGGDVLSFISSSIVGDAGFSLLALPS